MSNTTSPDSSLRKHSLVSSTTSIEPSTRKHSLVQSDDSFLEKKDKSKDKEKEKGSLKKPGFFMRKLDASDDDLSKYISSEGEQTSPASPSLSKKGFSSRMSGMFKSRRSTVSPAESPSSSRKFDNPRNPNRASNSALNVSKGPKRGTRFSGSSLDIDESQFHTGTTVPTPGSSSPGGSIISGVLQPVKIKTVKRGVSLFGKRKGPDDAFSRQREGMSVISNTLFEGTPEVSGFFAMSITEQDGFFSNADTPASEMSRLEGIPGGIVRQVCMSITEQDGFFSNADTPARKCPGWREYLEGL